MGLVKPQKLNTKEFQELHLGVVAQGWEYTGWVFIDDLRYKKLKDFNSYIKSLLKNPELPKIVFLNIQTPSIESILLNSGFEIGEFEFNAGIYEYGLFHEDLANMPPFVNSLYS